MTAAVLLLSAVTLAPAQSQELRLDDTGAWTRVNVPAPGSDAAVFAKAREQMARKLYGTARETLTDWIEANELGGGPLVAEAYLLRGDCFIAKNREEDALRDWEVVVKDYATSEFFAAALEREAAVASRYLNGLRRKVLGMRIDSGVPMAEEIILRLNERLPGSRLAETSLLELADYYYRERELKMASETYDVFLTLFPKSEFREKALQRKIYANISRFKGPRYDATGLIDAKIEVAKFAREFPASAERAGMTETLVSRLDEASAATMLDTAKYYLKRSDAVSARLMCTKLLERYPGTEAAGRAVEIMEREGFPLPGAPRTPPAPAQPESPQ